MRSYEIIEQTFWWVIFPEVEVYKQEQSDHVSRARTVGKAILMNAQLYNFIMSNYVIIQLNHVNIWWHTQPTVQILDLDPMKDFEYVSLLI